MAAFLVGAVAIGGAQQVPQGIKLKLGDRFSVIVQGFSDYSRSYTILDDGTVLGFGFDRFVAAGKTVDEIKLYVTTQLTKTIKDPQVTVLIDSIRPLYVFVNSVTGQVLGPVEYVPELNLRQIVSRVVIPERKEDYEVRVFREGKEIFRQPFIKVLNGPGPDGSLAVKPNDVVSVLDRPVMRVWAMGQVAKPGEFRVFEQATAQQLLLQAGGVAGGLELTSLYKVKLKRGPEVFDIDPAPTAAPFPIEAGDTLFVEVPHVIQVTLGGEIRSGGEKRVREGTNILQLIEGAGGISGSGSYQDVLVFRKGQAMIVDAGKVITEGKMVDFVIEDGDTVWIQQNLRRVTMLGSIRRPGPIGFRDGVEMRLADAVANAGGPDESGSMRHIFLGRKQSDGKIKVTEYHLDMYLQDGDVSQNPVLQPGDVVVIGRPKGLTVQGATQVLSNFLILDTIIRH